jgi:hypothetical protein
MCIAALTPVLSHIERLGRDAQPRQVAGHYSDVNMPGLNWAGTTFLGDISFSASREATHADEDLGSLQRVEGSHGRAVPEQARGVVTGDVAIFGWRTTKRRGKGVGAERIEFADRAHVS